MTKTGTDYSAWSELTSSVNTSVSGIVDLASLTFTTTTMTPFTSFNEDISSFNTAVAKLQSFTSTDVTHMNQAAENKVTDDSHQAQAPG